MSFFLVVSARELAILQSCVENSLEIRRQCSDSTPDLTREMEELIEQISKKPLSVSAVRMIGSAADA